MSLTSGDILTRVTTITGSLATTAADILDQLKTTLVDLSKRGDFIKTSTTGTITANADTITVPTGMIGEPDHLDFDTADANVTGSIILHSITFNDYLTGAKHGVARRGNTLYIVPAPSASKDYTLYYTKKHAFDAATIEFDDDFKDAVIYGVAAKIFTDYGVFDKADRYISLYEIEIQKLKSDYTEAPNPGPISRLI